MSTLDLVTVESLSFDCYGTLIDWEAGLSRALHALLGKEGRPLLPRYAEIEAELEAGPYRRYREILRMIGERLAEEQGVTLQAGAAERFAASVDGWEPFSDTVEALRQLHRRCRLIILSNIDRDLFAETNRKLGVMFDRVITAEDVGAYKPSERNFEALLRVVDREKHVHVAQSLFHDHAPAQRMGLRSIWMNRYGKSKGAVLQAGARYDLELPDLASLAQRVNA